jgi:uncharacterized membrane protein YesL
MSDNSSPIFREMMASVFCITVSIAMIWYILPTIIYYDTRIGKPLAYAFTLGFILIIVYAGFGLFKMLFHARAESCPICSLISREKE